ncbi:MAG: head GIN domain-containing protein [Bacteroidota bacterium]
MKKVILSLTILLAGVSVAFSQKVINDANAEVRSVAGFHGVDVGGGIDLYLSQGEEAVAVSAADTRFRDRIRTEVKNGILKIWYDYKSGFRIETGSKKMKAYVSFKNLDQLGGSGGSDIYVDGAINVKNLALDLSGGADFRGKVTVGEIKVVASGGSDANISGTASNLTVDASGGSDFKGYDLVVETCSLEASGGSDVYITVNKEMTASASGGSDIFYKGNGLIREIKSSGSSDIKKVSR